MTMTAENARTERIEEALKAMDGNEERISLTWMGSAQVFPVVKLPLDSVVLNPRSHRIREQLESSPHRQMVLDDPFSDAAQAVLSQLLEETEGFDTLRGNLEEYGQIDPGVVTRAGVLVNANTRAVALRRLDPHGTIRVAVLPADADSKSIARLELGLQMKKELRQDYTFANQLLFVEELKTEFGYSDEDVAKEMNLAATADAKELQKGVKQAAQYTRILALIRDMRRRSGDRIPLGYFNPFKQALADLDDAYEAQKTRDPAGAEQVKEARLLGILVGGEYRKLRFLKADNVEGYLVQTLRDDEYLGGSIAAVMDTKDDDEEDPPGLDDLADDPVEQPTGSNIGALTTLVASSYGEETVSLPSTEEDEETLTIERDDLVKSVTGSVGDAIDEIERTTKLSKELDGPAKLIAEAKRSTDRALDAYRTAALHPDFDAGAAAKALEKLKASVDALEIEISAASDD